MLPSPAKVAHPEMLKAITAAKKKNDQSRTLKKYASYSVKRLQTIKGIGEITKLAPHWNPQLAEVHNKELTKGNRNRATLAVARKLVA